MEKGTRFVGLDVHKASITAAVATRSATPSARQFMAYVGLVPSEWSSGESRHRGRITKTGNRLIRHVLGQAAHNARYRPNVSSGLRARQRQVPPAIVELDRRAQARLHRRYRSLVGRIGKNKTVIAVARELAGFVWAAGQHVTPTAAIEHEAGHGRAGQQRREPSTVLCDPNSRP